MFKKIFFSLFTLSAFVTQAQQSVTFNYTGAVQTWTVPPCVYSIQVDVRGAKGGGILANPFSGSGQGGNGARVQHPSIAVTPGQVLEIYVGGNPSGPTGGWNGGGNGQASPSNNQYASKGGGGASDIRIAPYAMNNRIVVAGGGGGRAGGSGQPNYQASGGQGGCAIGQTGLGSPFTNIGGGGGTQTAGGNGGPPWNGGLPGTAGSIGQGGNGGLYSTASGGGGGGGYFGGGGGGSDNCCVSANGGGGGGGGSSFYPAGGTCTQGFQTGNGQVIISYSTLAINNVPPLCEGSTLNFIASSGQTNYSWTGPNGFSSNLQNPTLTNITTAMAGTYLLSAGACNASITVQINPNIQAVFNQIPDLCINGVAPALPTASTNNIPYTGVWSPATISTVNAGTFTYTFTPTAGQCAFPATMDIVVHALTTPQFNPMGQICQFMTNVVIPTTATNTSSYLNGPLITGSWNNPTVITTAPGTVNYTFTPNPNQCATNLTFPITVDPLILPLFTQIPQLCQDDANPIFPTISNNVPGITGTWTPPNIDTSIPGIITHTFLPDPGQCGDTTDMTITIVPAVPPVFVADTLSGCNPLLVNLSTIGAVQGAVYTWYWGGTQIGQGSNFAYTFDASGYHDITLEYNLLGCIETTTYNDYIYMESNPEASFAALPGALTESTMPIQFVNNSAGALTYLWDFDDNTTSTEENPNHMYEGVSEDLLVTLTAYTSLGCSDEYQLNIPVISEPIYYVPNTFTPDEDEHNQNWQAIFTTGFDPHAFHLAVFNRWGEVIWETQDATQAWDGTYGPDGVKVPSGMYTWKLQFETKENDYRKIVTGSVNLIR
jgi:gliding motility-associated-like protein